MRIKRRIKRRKLLTNKKKRKMRRFKFKMNQQRRKGKRKNRKLKNYLLNPKESKER
jgi:hypothetical protein